MTTLSGPVGLRNGITLVNNASIDQGKVSDLLWRIDPGNGGMSGLGEKPSAQAPPQIAPELAAAIVAFQAFWVARGEFRVPDGVVDPGGRTLRKLDSLAGSSPTPPTPPSPEEGFMDLNVLSFLQTEPSVEAASLSIPAVDPGSVMPFLFTPRPKGSRLVEGSAGATMSQMMFKIRKTGATFWVGACVAAGTSDFSRAYIYFHPDTISATDDAGYPNFTGRWPDVKRYLPAIGLQMAAVKQMPLLVPFMTHASRANSSSTNLFADRGIETISDILFAIELSLGRTTTPTPLQSLGVASYSSGVDHLFRFAQKLGSSGLIREQIDFDSAFMIVPHQQAPALPGAVNWMVSQSSPPSANRIGWVHLPVEAFRNINTMRGDTHGQIGFLLFKAMMTFSSMA